jgi:hypothetical protein
LVALAIAHQSVMPDFDKALGQEVQAEAAHKLLQLHEGVGPGERVLTYLALNRGQAILSFLPPSVSSFAGTDPCYGVIVKRRSVFRSSFLFSHSKRSFFSALFSFGSPSLAVLRFQ